MKKEKGITLVALIITIIVLLILAVVTISAVNEGSLFAHANNAATSYSKSQEEENTMISNWLTELAKHENKNVTSTLTFADVAGTYYKYENGEKVAESYCILNSDGTGMTVDPTITSTNFTYQISGNGLIADIAELEVVETGTFHNVKQYFTFSIENGIKQLVHNRQVWDEYPSGITPNTVYKIDA